MKILLSKITLLIKMCIQHINFYILHRMFQETSLRFNGNNPLLTFLFWPIIFCLCYFCCAHFLLLIFDSTISRGGLCSSQPTLRKTEQIMYFLIESILRINNLLEEINKQYEIRFVIFIHPRPNPITNDIENMYRTKECQKYKLGIEKETKILVFLENMILWK